MHGLAVQSHKLKWGWHGRYGEQRSWSVFLSLHGIKLLRFWMHCWPVLFLHSMVSCRLLVCVAAACILSLLRIWMVRSLLNWYDCSQSSVQNLTKSDSEVVWSFGFLVTLPCLVSMESCPVHLKCGPHMQHSMCFVHYIECACDTCSLVFKWFCLLVRE